MTVADTQMTLSDVDSLAEARAWKSSHPDAYAQIVSWAKLDMRHHVRPSIDFYFNLLRRPEFSRLLGFTPVASDPYLMNNNLRSELARLVAQDEPSLADPKRGFRFRHSSSELGVVNANPAA